MTQYSLFGAAAASPALADLDGLLLAGGHWARSAGSPPAARLSIVVADRWRADALASAFARLGLFDRDRDHAAERAGAGTEAATTATPSDEVPDDAVIDAQGGFAARTAFTPLLTESAARWTRGARTGLPPTFELSAGGLRLWAVAAGRRDDTGYLLGTVQASNTAPDDTLHRAAGAQLARLGVAALSMSRRSTGWGTGWRVTSLRRLRRLAELLGPPPPGGEADWPAGR